ncbi:helix-turn-helix domain-containing protein [Dyadobacter bucti]|uniref:helix-turn-helix domain-containing protein n=1 Tax=Dyadobacter bucti TaxID=2572203 RepID=UPI003F714644
MKNSIYKTESEYEKAMVEIDHLMKKGEANLSDQELATIRQMALSAEAYEKEYYYIEPPKTLEGMIELRMYELKLKQKELAETLGVSETKLSMILNKKQKPDIPFIKAVHEKLSVSAEFILQHI